jgi:Ca2+-binding EF-hand superfamily protein
MNALTYLLPAFRTSFACPLAGVLILATTLVGPVLAADDAPPQSAGDTALFDRLDANHDSAIRGDEVAKEHRSLFARLVRNGDKNHDAALSREEFLAALIPSRPERPLETKESATLPHANAVRYVLLMMDADRNARIEKDEVPSQFQTAFATMAERLDKNSDGKLDRQELSRGGPAMSAVAGRYVQRLEIDVDAELAKLKKSQGAAFDRFERQPMPLQALRNPQQAREMFAQIDENGDGKLEAGEVPEPLQQPLKRLTRLGDRDRDGKLDEKEFVAATEMAAKFLKQRRGDDMRRDKRP